MHKAPVAPVDLLFETSWEVCNKIGGIYTVLSTKAKTLQSLYKDKVIFIGPDVWTPDNPSPYFLPSDSILKAWRKSASLPEGISVRCGRWDVPGKPIVILVKFDSLYASNPEFFGKMWELYGVDSLHEYGDYGEGCAFARAAGMVIESLCAFKKFSEANNVIAHFDEWTTGMGLLYVKWKVPYVATIFTTHATSNGRSICGNGKHLYEYLHAYNGDQMARELNMEAKHSLEKTAAHQADCFTTVSEVTAIECEQLLDRRPDIVTPNGFEQNFVPPKSRFKTAREAARQKLLQVASTLIGRELPHHTFLVATSGRCEYRNKGIAVCLASINRLAQMDTQRHVVAFVLVPAWMKEPRLDLQEALAQPSKPGDTSAQLPDPVITHWLNNPNEAPIIGRIHSLGFANASQRQANVIYVPCYLNGVDGIFNSSYYDLLIGFDATVFPSYYEPWGYTPLESIAFGVPTITTSLSGFGQWALDTTDDQFESGGVVVVGRNDNNYDDVTYNIARSLRFLAQSSEATLQEISQQAMATAERAAWSYFIEYYVEAFDIALRHCHERQEK